MNVVIMFRSWRIRIVLSMTTIIFIILMMIVNSVFVDSMLQNDSIDDMPKISTMINERIAARNQVQQQQQQTQQNEQHHDQRHHEQKQNKRTLRRRPTVKLLILAGDENIEGYASISHLTELIHKENAKNATKQYSHLGHQSNNSKSIEWNTIDNVYITYEHYHLTNGTVDKLLYTKCSINNSIIAGNIHSFGPEIQIGYTLRQMYNNNNNEPIIIVKAGWHDRSLNKDYINGFQYFRLLDTLEKTIQSLYLITGNNYYRHSYIDYIGFVWWQGYVDFKNRNYYKQYTNNLNELIQNKIRNTLKDRHKKPLKQLPVIIVELGYSGNIYSTPLENDFRFIQQNIVKQLDISTTSYVSTSYIVDKYLYNHTHNHHNHLNNNNTMIQQQQQELLTRIHNPRNESNYYYGRADIIIDISQSIALSLIDLNIIAQYNKRNIIYKFIMSKPSKASNSINNNAIESIDNTNNEYNDNHNDQQQDIILESKLQVSIMIYSFIVLIFFLCIIIFSMKYYTHIYNKYSKKKKKKKKKKRKNRQHNRSTDNDDGEEGDGLIIQSSTTIGNRIATLFRPSLETINETQYSNDNDDDESDDSDDDDDEDDIMIQLNQMNERTIEKRAKETNNYGVKAQY